MECVNHTEFFTSTYNQKSHIRYNKIQSFCVCVQFRRNSFFKKPSRPTRRTILCKTARLPLHSRVYANIQKRYCRRLRCKQGFLCASGVFISHARKACYGQGGSPGINRRISLYSLMQHVFHHKQYFLPPPQETPSALSFRRYCCGIIRLRRRQKPSPLPPFPPSSATPFAAAASILPIRGGIHQPNCCSGHSNGLKASCVVWLATLPPRCQREGKLPPHPKPFLFAEIACQTSPLYSI